ncbi:MAG: mycofactocin biosynthesis glycosyltransferase MftF [Myxococcota bacterium]
MGEPRGTAGVDLPAAAEQLAARDRATLTVVVGAGSEANADLVVAGPDVPAKAVLASASALRPHAHLALAGNVSLGLLHGLGTRLDPVLEDVRPGLAVYRQEPPRRYVRQAGLSLTTSESGDEVLFARAPLFAQPLSAVAARVARALAEPRTLVELAREAQLSIATVAPFVHGLVARDLVRVTPRAGGSRPPVTVVIPAYGRPDATRACVRAVLAGRVLPEEVLVVDDASDPPLAPALAELPRVRVLRLERNGGPARARNRGLDAARTEHLAFLDNDCVPDPEWLGMLLGRFDEAQVDVVGGRACSPTGPGLLTRYEAVRSPLDMGPEGGEVGLGRRVAYLPSCNLAARRSRLRRLGGFDETLRLGEDVDLVWRVGDSGGRVLYEPRARVAHAPRTRLGAWLARRADYASSEGALQERHPGARRELNLPVQALLLLAWLAWPTPGLALAFGAAALHALAADRRRLRCLRRELGWPALLASRMRALHSSLYHLSASATRYDSGWLLLAAAWLPWLRAPALALTFYAAVVDGRTRARGGPWLPAFLALHLLDMLAYQVGLLRGCWVHRTLLPLRPRLVWRR